MSFAPRSPGCYQHCLIWFGDDPVQIGCAHCSFVSRHVDLSATYTSEELATALECSRSGHDRHCIRPRRPQSGRPQRAQ